MNQIYLDQVLRKYVSIINADFKPPRCKQGGERPLTGYKCLIIDSEDGFVVDSLKIATAGVQRDF